MVEQVTTFTIVARQYNISFADACTIQYTFDWKNQMQHLVRLFVSFFQAINSKQFPVTGEHTSLQLIVICKDASLLCIDNSHTIISTIKVNVSLAIRVNYNNH